MSIRNLDALFNPRSIAVIGASDDRKDAGYYVMRKLTGNGFEGIVHAVNPIAEEVQDVLSYKNINDIPYPVDLAIVASPRETLVDVLDECGRKNVKAVLILAHVTDCPVEDPGILQDQIKRLSSIYGFRVIGPDSLGFLRPGINLNAGLLPRLPRKGNIAFVSQGGNFASAFLEHAMSKNVGFSYFISLGGKLDVDLSDIIDFLGMDISTKAIVLHIQEIRNGARFMAAVRSFAGSRPVIIIKTGRPGIFPGSAVSSGMPASEGKIYEAAFKRAGAVKVDDVSDILYMIEALAKQNRPKGKRLCIISNSIAPADMAVDMLLRFGGELAQPANKANPIYLHSNALPADYAPALKSCLSEDVDGILFIHIPFPGIDAGEVAEVTASVAATCPGIPVFAALLGDETVAEAREYFNTKNIPTYFMPDQAVKCFMYMYRYDDNLRLLRETPEIVVADFTPQTEKAERIVSDSAERGRQSISPDEAAEILEAYGIPCRISSPATEHPAAGCELTLGAKKTRNFGTVIVFGAGGLFRGATMDYAIGLPPLNRKLARHLMEETGICKYLGGMDIFKDSLEFLEEVLARFSQLIVDFPQIDEVDINPFLLTENGGAVLKASIDIDVDMHKACKWNKGDLCTPHLAIPTYPFKYVRESVLKDGTSILIRPVRGEDEPAMRRFFESLSDETVVSRFGLLSKSITHEKLVRFCQIDYDRELAFVSVVGEAGKEIIGDATLNKLPDLENAELSFMISDQWQGKGVGNVLMDYCIWVAREIGLKSLWMEIQKDNVRMINFGGKYGFRQTYDDEDSIKVALQLQ